MIKVYPNPTHSHINIEFLDSDYNNIKIIFINTLGDAVLIEEYKSVVKGNILEIKVSALKKGLYTVNIIGNKIVYSKALLVQ